MAKYDYTPFGKLVNTFNNPNSAFRNPFLFSSEYHDEETGLVYYNYRYYNPELGRWMSCDPIGERGGLNLYGMVNNNPIGNWDHLGNAVVVAPVLTYLAKEVAKTLIINGLKRYFKSYVNKLINNAQRMNIIKLNCLHKLNDKNTEWFEIDGLEDEDAFDIGDVISDLPSALLDATLGKVALLKKGKGKLLKTVQKNFTKNQTKVLQWSGEKIEGKLKDLVLKDITDSISTERSYHARISKVKNECCKVKVEFMTSISVWGPWGDNEISDDKITESVIYDGKTPYSKQVLKACGLKN